MYFFPVMVRAITLVSVSHDPSEIILICRFGAQVKFLLIINV